MPTSGQATTVRKPYFDVVLVQPNITWVYDPFEHLGLAYLAAALRADGFSVKIIDAVLLRLSMKDLYRELDAMQIGVLGVTLISHGYLVTTRFLEFYKARHPETKIAGGGHFATFAAEKIHAHTRAFDVIALGEGELSFPRYCRVVLRGEPLDHQDLALPEVPIERSESRIIDMDSLPFPARDNLPLAMERGAKPGITSSRGCYARCSFCTVHTFYKAKNGPRWVARSWDSVIEELERLHRDFKIDHFMFVDDNFVGPGDAGRARALDFAEAYRRSGLPMSFHIDCRAIDVHEPIIAALKEVGLRSIFVGIESVSMSDLVLYKKGLKAQANWNAARIIKQHGFDYTMSMIMFNPDTTERQILDNVAFLKQVEYYPRNPISILNLYEGTGLTASFQDVVHGPFWDYRFTFKRESIKVIYEESLRFCKDTLPFERELSLRDDGDLEGRRALHRIRLLFLEDLTRSLATETVDAVRQRWNARVAELRDDRSATWARSVAESRFGVERLYMTGAELDPPSSVPSTTCE
jgi:anaerobic magnesium-protoporphyrin IX monomethyl ester cyclase